MVAAEFGTLVHYWKETGVIQDGRLGLALKKKLKLTEVQRETYWHEGLHEVPVAYNVVTGKAEALVLPVAKEKRDEWKAAHGDEWITGTADYVGLILDAPWVDDLKTGKNVEYLDHRYQQGFYALCWTLFQMGRLTPARSTITHWPKYPLPKKPLRFGTVLVPEFFEELQVKLAELRNSVRRLRVLKEDGMNLENRLTDGAHCIYCPSKLACAKGLKYE